MSGRSTIFLREMGLGPQWLLRGAVGEAADMPAEVTAEEAAEVTAQGGDGVTDAAFARAVHAAVSETAGEPGDETRTAPASMAASDAADRAGTNDAVDDDAMQPVRPVPGLPDVAPAVPGARAGDDTAWFDAAPTPPPKPPVLKQVAPPAPKQNAAPRARTAEPEAVEDTSWFDAVPAAPVSRAPARGAATDDDIAAMEWPDLQAAVRGCTRCALCQTRREAVPGRGDEQARWLVLGTAPTVADEDVAEPLSGEPGRLLDNMLRAVDLSTRAGAYVTTLVKCRAVAADGSDRLPATEELAACRPYLQRELALTGARMVLTLGGASAKGLLGTAARGKVLRHGALPVVATFHPADLLRKPEQKAGAWADLCLARAADAGRG
jgi:uracil-DNA glycosylase family 4